MMPDDLRKLSLVDLRNLAGALRSGRLDLLGNTLAVQRIVSGEHASSIAGLLRDLAGQGFGPLQVATTLDLLVAERQRQPRLADALDLVTTGPEVRGVANRDTSVVVRELFAGAVDSVLVVGFAIYQGQQVFQTLADRMLERPGLRVRMVVDIPRLPGDTSAASELVYRFRDRFRTQQWPADRPVPEVFYDPRSLEPRGDFDKRSSMHAKCVVVDRRQVFITSANFTEAAQQRNIEVGVLVDSAPTADKLAGFFERLAEEGSLRRGF
jgi:phosphatidylserine/phosphatidylglycerophosphate/cardiolipin synthase-like enzyme